MKLSKAIIPFIATAILFGCSSESSNKSETKNEVRDTTLKTTVVDDQGMINLEVDIEKSTIKWTGSEPGKEHFGSLKLQNGTFSMNNSLLIMNGEANINLLTLTVEDIEDEGKSNKLLGHLTNADFLSVDEFPEASIIIEGSENNKDTESNTATGLLMIKGVEQPFSSEYRVQLANEQYIIDGTINFDRTKFGINYKSKSIFSDLGDKFINDNVEIEFRLVCNQ